MRMDSKLPYSIRVRVFNFALYLSLRYNILSTSRTLYRFSVLNTLTNAPYASAFFVRLPERTPWNTFFHSHDKFHAIYNGEETMQFLTGKASLQLAELFPE